MRIRHFRSFLCLVVALRFAGIGAADAERPGLAERLGEVFDDELLASASIGVLIVRTASGEVLYERDADRALVPASNMKLVTAAGALRFLGADFRYRTSLCAGRAPNGQGWIVADLYIRGSGDPTLTHEDLDALAQRLAECGVMRIAGDIVADASCFPGPPLGLGWSWSDQTYAYSAQVSGLAVDRNVVRAEVIGGSNPGARCELALTPPSDYLRLDRACVTGEKDAERPRVFRRRAENVVATTAPVPAGSRISARISLEEPDVYVARLLKQHLAERGIRVDGGCVRGKTPGAVVALASHDSPPLRDILAMMNIPSDNSVAEALMRTLPIPQGKPGAAGEGTKMLEEWFAEIGIAPEPLRLCDGSGLSRLDLLTPRALVTLLRHMALDPQMREPFVRSLPVAGEEGTVRNRMKDTPAAGRIRAKTGSLWGVCALSGYVEGQDECELSFSMLMNNYTCGGTAVRKLQDRACVILAEHLAP